MNYRRKFHFDEAKSTQLAALFLRLRGGRMKHLKLIKLMYLTDRESFRRWGHPITGDMYYSMENGPVLSNVLDLIGSEPLPNKRSIWLESITARSGHDVELVSNIGVGRLSENEQELAKEIFEQYGHMNRWKLVEMTHHFPEYRRTDEENRRWPLPYEDLLAAVGKSPEDAKRICDHLSGVSRVKTLLSI